MMARVHSESVLAAHLFHGWSIDCVHRDEVSGTVAEHTLSWGLPEPARRPSLEEIESFVHVSDVEDKFAIQDRGVVIAPGLPREKEGLLRHEDFIVLHDYAERFILTQVRALELYSPPSPRGWGILLPPEITDESVIVGMQVWARDTRKREQDGETDG